MDQPHAWGGVALLAVDDDLLAARLSACLFESGLRPIIATTEASANELVKRQPPRLIVITEGFAGADAVELAGRLKRRAEHIGGSRPAVVMLAEAVDARRMLAARRAGVDEYMTGVDEDASLLTARLERLLPGELAAANTAGGRGGVGDERSIEIGRITIRPWAYDVLVDGERVELTLTQFRLLMLLAERPGRVVEAGRMQRHLADHGANLQPNSIKSHVYFLRQKLGEAGEQIENLRRIGYRLKQEA